MKKNLWLIEAFDIRNCRHFIPDPGVFETEKEAQAFCEFARNDTLVCAYKKIRLGHIKCQGAKE